MPGLSLRRPVFLSFLTLGLWLFALPASALRRHGSKGAAAAWSSGAVVSLIVMGVLGGCSGDKAVATGPAAATTPARALMAPARTPTSESVASRPQVESMHTTATPALTTPSQVPLGPSATSAPAATFGPDACPGVGRAGAVDHVSGGGPPVTTVDVNDEVYSVNAGRDRDNDGIACERA